MYNIFQIKRFKGFHLFLPHSIISHIVVLCNSTGRSPVTNYIVQRKAVSEARWEDIGAGVRIARPTVTVKDLRPDEEYEFRVIAENAAGCSQTSAPSQSVKYGTCH